MNDFEFEHRVTEFLRDESARAVDTGRAWLDVQGLRRARKTRLLAAISAAAAVACAVAIPAALAHVGRAGHGRAPAAAESARAGLVHRYPGAVVARISVAAGQVVAVAGAVWVLGSGPRPLTRISTRTNKITTQVPLPAAAGPPASIAAGGGWLWVDTAGGEAAGQLLRLDPVTGRVLATVHLPESGSCSGAAYGAGGLWVECAAARQTEFLRVDTATGAVTASVGPLPGTYLSAVAASDSLWYQTELGVRGLIRHGTGWRTVTVDATGYPVALLPDSMVYGLGAVWVMTRDESIARIDPATGRVTAVFSYRDFDPDYQDHLAFLAVGARSLWLLGPQAQVLRLDAGTGGPLGSVPALGSCGQPCTLEYFAHGSVWVPTGTTLFRIDPARIPG
jgi:hypothetical protein